MLSIDELAYKSSFRFWPPLGKLLLSLSLLLASLLSPTPLVPLIVFSIGVSLLWFSIRLKLPSIMALACLQTFIMLFISIIILALVIPGEKFASFSLFGILFVITREGLNFAILVFSRVLAGFAVLLFFATSTPIPHLFYAMRQLGFPSFLAELVVLIYRYSFMIIEQIGQMIQAAGCRLGFNGALCSLKTFGKITAVLFARSMDFAERAQISLSCRNFKGEFMPFRNPKQADAIWLIIPFALFLSLIIIGNSYPSFLVI
jgi:cobalt ECF transporter T component CbiQ